VPRRSDSASTVKMSNRIESVRANTSSIRLFYDHEPASGGSRMIPVVMSFKFKPSGAYRRRSDVGSCGASPETEPYGCAREGPSLILLRNRSRVDLNLPSM
jgi:hypothetical protein